MIQRLGIGLSALLIMASGCKQMDDFAIPSALNELGYALSSDTIKLDTLASEYLSSTYIFKIYNPNNTPLDFSTIQLYGGETRGLSLNVDGMAGHQHHNVSILGRDSLHLFIRAYLPKTNINTPETITDTLTLIRTSGQTHHIPIHIVRQNVDQFKALIINSDTDLEAHRPLLIRDSLVINEGVTLRLKSPSQIWLSEHAYIRVNGRLEISGTSTAPVRMGSIRRDSFLPKINYQLVSGQWGGIVVGEHGSVKAEHLHLINSKWGISLGNAHEYAPSPRLELRHCKLSNIAGVGISAGTGTYTIADSELSNTLGSVLSLSGGIYEISRSSIINLYAWPGIRSGASLYYTNDTNTTSKLTLDHCVIDGALSVSQVGTSSNPRQRGGELEIKLHNPQGEVVRITRSYLRSIDYRDSLGITMENVELATRSLSHNEVYRSVGINDKQERTYHFDFRPLNTAPFVHKGGNGSGYTDLSGRVRHTPMTLGAYEP